MSRTRDIALYLAAALAGVASAYVVHEWVLPWWTDARDDKPNPSSQPKTADDEVPVPVADDEHADPNRGARTLPPLRTHALPPPIPNGRAILSRSSLGSNPDAMTSSASLHTLSTQDDLDQDGASHPNTSDADTEPFVDVLSPPPTQVISRRRSLRNHDLFAASHISFSELGSLVAPEDEENQPHSD